MSHLKERKEKNCLNCQATLYGRYCHVCGQENLEPKETVWHLVSHFFNDITHFDGKFFSTVKFLLRKPGFLSREYVAGRRASYLNPIRMYVFTSAIFFLILFALKNPRDMVNVNEKPDRERAADLRQMQANLQQELASDGVDSAARQRIGEAVRQSVPTHRDSAAEGADDNRPSFFGLNSGHYTTNAAYDSAQRALPDSLRDGWLKRALMYKIIAANTEFNRDKKAYFEHVAENMLHSIPKVLFVSLPLFALILNIMYVRRRKTFYYVDHGIFTIHLYCATFILTMAALLLYQLAQALKIGWLTGIIWLLIVAIWFYIVIYLYKAMRGFYRQGRFKTFLKYCMVCLLSFIVNSIIFVIFALLSVVSV
ncbi:MAG TPA: DUF3667 domain-containing protein [Puia sp.]|nr:DUF3667 domain-containing protein [Puia sp.]